MTVSPFARRLLTLLLVFALGLGAAAGLSACGGSSSKSLLPAADADALKSDLDDVAGAVADQDCTQVGKALNQLDRDLTQLPAGTSARLKTRLREGYDRLRNQAAKECQADTTSTQTIPTTTTVVPTTPPVTTTTTPPTTPTTTVPTTTPTTPPTTTPTTPPDNGGITTP